MEEKKEGEAWICIGNTEFKKDYYKERNLRKRFSVGKYLRWDVSERKWNSNLKWLEKELKSDEMKNIHALTFVVDTHGNSFGDLQCKNEINYRERFKQVVELFKQHYLNKDKNRMYFKVKACNSATGIKQPKETCYNRDTWFNDFVDNSDDVFIDDIYCRLRQHLGSEKTKQVYCSYDITHNPLYYFDTILFSYDNFNKNLDNGYDELRKKYKEIAKSSKNIKEIRKKFYAFLEEKNKKEKEKQDEWREKWKDTLNMDNMIPDDENIDLYYMYGPKRKKYVPLSDYCDERLSFDKLLNKEGERQKKTKDNWLRENIDKPVDNKLAKVKKEHACCCPWF